MIFPASKDVSSTASVFCVWFFVSASGIFSHLAPGSFSLVSNLFFSNSVVLFLPPDFFRAPNVWPFYRLETVLFHASKHVFPLRNFLPLQNGFLPLQGNGVGSPQQISVLSVVKDVNAVAKEGYLIQLSVIQITKP